MDVKLLNQDFIKENFIHIKTVDQLSDGTLGTSEERICKTCRLLDCVGHMGYIVLRREIPHPIFIQKICIKLLRYCWKCKKPANSTLDLIPDYQLFQIKDDIAKKYKPVCSYCGNHIKPMNIKWESKKFSFYDTSSSKIKIHQLSEDCKEFILRYMPIMPPQIGRNLLSQYIKLFSPSSNQYDIYNDLLGLAKKGGSYSIIKDISGKHGIFEQEVIGKRLSMCGRSVITPSPSLDIDKVLIPNSFEKRMKISDGDFVLFNRQPTLKKHSILALKVIINQDKNIKTICFNPCLCKSYNADFDGDEMNIFLVPKTEKSQREAEKMLPSKNILSDYDEKPIIYPHQDCLIALGKDIINETKNEYLSGNKDISTFILQKQKFAYDKLEKECFSLTSFKESIKHIIKTGARGSEENFKQMFDELGKQKISVNTKVKGNIVINNTFEKGLTFDEMFIHCQASRESIISVGVNTPNSGYLEKKMIRSMGNMFYDDESQLHQIRNKIVSFEKF